MSKIIKKLKLKPILGWREWVTLPELHVLAIKVKVDSGAKTSALHASDIEYFRRGNKDWVKFKIYPLQKSERKAQIVKKEVIDMRTIRSSVGVETHRPIIRTEIRLAGQSWEIELSLVDRDIMGFRMLLGREALKKGFLINPNKSFLVSTRDGNLKRD